MINLFTGLFVPVALIFLMVLAKMFLSLYDWRLRPGPPFAGQDGK
jgi:drug/metabolite transporter superfamily protein YnfA